MTSLDEKSERITGVVSGDSVQLDRASSIPDGTPVELAMRVRHPESFGMESRLAALFGSCREEIESLDEFDEWSREQRRLERADEHQ